MEQQQVIHLWFLHFYLRQPPKLSNRTERSEFTETDNEIVHLAFCNYVLD